MYVFLICIYVKCFVVFWVVLLLNVVKLILVVFVSVKISGCSCFWCVVCFERDGGGMCEMFILFEFFIVDKYFWISV